MEPEKYKLKWQTHLDNFRNMLHEMMKSKDLTDVTLVCEDRKHFKVHKVVLSACSSVFKSIVNDIPQNCSVIYLSGIQHQEMKSILDFIYLGEAIVCKENMDDFVTVAKSLDIKEFVKSRETVVDSFNHWTGIQVVVVFQPTLKIVHFFRVVFWQAHSTFELRF